MQISKMLIYIFETKNLSRTAIEASAEILSEG